MLLKVVLSAAVFFSLLAASCGRQRSRVQPSSAQLVGAWQLRIGNDCQGYPVRSDTMVLNSDGTFDQYTIAKDGRHLDSRGQHWSYMEEGKISFDKRRDWDAHWISSLGSSNPQTSAVNNPEGVTELQVLIVQFGSPPTILINPNSDCLYIKVN
jgi:hypothetical protein